MKLALLSTALLLAGCVSLAPSGAPTNPPLRADFRVGDADPALAAAEASAWDAFFADARLREVVQLALSGNRSLRASAGKLKRALVATGPRSHFGDSGSVSNGSTTAMNA